MPITLEEISRLRKSCVKHKFGAVRCERNKIKFPSKLERSYYDQLNLRKQSGEVLFFLRQVAFDLPGGVRYICDFQVFLSSGEIEFIDTKGKDTPISIAKRKMVEDLYPLEIKIVRRV
jgi:hypothetical protein